MVALSRFGNLGALGIRQPSLGTVMVITPLAKGGSVRFPQSAVKKLFILRQGRGCLRSKSGNLGARSRQCGGVSLFILYHK